MHILQILHDRERGGVQTLAAMIEQGLVPHDVTFETVYLFPRPGLSTFGKLRCAFAMASSRRCRERCGGLGPTVESASKALSARNCSSSRRHDGQVSRCCSTFARSSPVSAFRA